MLCSKKGYRPIVIFDSVKGINQVKKAGFKNLFIYENDLGSEEGLKNLEDLVNYLLKKYFKKSPIKNFTKIKKSASNDSLPVSKIDFQKKLTIKHPGFKVTGEYLGSKISTEIICPKGHIINTTPNQILHDDYNCPICSKNKPNPRKMNREEFVSRLNEKHPNIKLLGKFSGLDEKANFKCTKCNKSRNTKASNVLYSKYGCNICARKQNGLKSRTTHEEFVKKLENIKPGIIVLGKYRTSKDHIRVKCKVCKHE